MYKTHTECSKRQRTSHCPATHDRYAIHDTTRVHSEAAIHTKSHRSTSQYTHSGCVENLSRRPALGEIDAWGTDALWPVNNAVKHMYHHLQVKILETLVSNGIMTHYTSCLMLVLLVSILWRTSSLLSPKETTLLFHFLVSPSQLNCVQCPITGLLNLDSRAITWRYQQVYMFILCNQC